MLDFFKKQLDLGNGIGSVPALFFSESLSLMWILNSLDPNFDDLNFLEKRLDLEKRIGSLPALPFLKNNFIKWSMGSDLMIEKSQKNDLIR